MAAEAANVNNSSSDYDQEYESGSEFGTSRLARAVSIIKDEVSTLIEPTKHLSSARPIHVSSIVFNLLQTTMGVGILSLAATFQFAGIVGGSIMFACAAALTYISMIILLEGLTLSHCQSYEALGEFCFGKYGKMWVQVTLIMCSMVALTCFLVPLKAFIYDTIKQMMHADAFDSFSSHGGSANMCLVVMLTLVILPLSLLRKIDKLWFTSLVGVFFVFYFVVVSIVYMIQHVNGDVSSRVCHELKSDNKPQISPDGSIHLFGSKAAEFMQAISIIACSFCCQMTVFPIYREVRIADAEQAAIKKVKLSALISMIIACVTYVTAASGGYVIWLDLCQKPSSILACYDPGDPFITLVYLGMSCVMMFAFPLVLFSIRYCLATILYGEEECKHLSTPMHIGLTLLIVAPVATVALLVDKLTVVIAIGGAFTAPGLCYVIPGVLGVQVRRVARLTCDTDDEISDYEGGVEDGIGHAVATRDRILKSSSLPAWGMLAFGCVAQVLCIVGAWFSIF